MSRKSIELVGTFEAHLILGVERSRIARFLHDNAAGRRKIAEPVAVLQCGPIWLKDDIEATAREMYDREAAGADVPPFDEWVVVRALKRAAALPNPLSAGELEAIIGRRVPVLA